MAQFDIFDGENPIKTIETWFPAIHILAPSEIDVSGE